MLKSLDSIIDDNEIEVGSYVPYTKYHQSGTKYMPRRPIFGELGEDPDELKKIQQIISNFFEEMIE